MTTEILTSRSAQGLFAVTASVVSILVFQLAMLA